MSTASRRRRRCPRPGTGKPIKRIRAGDGVSILAGRRLSVHVMVQPDAASGLLADPLLRDQGLLSRLLVAAPDSIAGTRPYRDTDPKDEAAIRVYGARILALLEGGGRSPSGKRNELEPREMSLSADREALAGVLRSRRGPMRPERDLRRSPTSLRRRPSMRPALRAFLRWLRIARRPRLAGRL